MAYGGKNNVTKQVVIYVKKNRHMSNRQQRGGFEL